MIVAYKYLAWAVLLIFGVAGGGLGWWRATKSLYLRNIGAEVLGYSSMKPGVLARRQMRRIIWTVADVAVGLVTGIIALMSLTRFQN